MRLQVDFVQFKKPKLYYSGAHPAENWFYAAFEGN